MFDILAERDRLAEISEGADSATLDVHWRRLLDLFESHPGDDLAFAECFHEFSIRQWHTYERRSSEVQERVAVWVSRSWRTEAKDIFDYCVGIIGSLGLDSCVGLVRTVVDDPSTEPALAADLAREIEGWGTPLDPWSGMG